MVTKEDDLIVIQVLLNRAKQDTNNIEWYLLKAYHLGENEVTIDKILEFPPETTILRLYNGDCNKTT